MKDCICIWESWLEGNLSYFSMGVPDYKLLKGFASLCGSQLLANFIILICSIDPDRDFELKLEVDGNKL